MVKHVQLTTEEPRILLRVKRTMTTASVVTLLGCVHDDAQGGAPDGGDVIEIETVPIAASVVAVDDTSVFAVVASTRTSDCPNKSTCTTTNHSDGSLRSFAVAVPAGGAQTRDIASRLLVPEPQSLVLAGGYAVFDGGTLGVHLVRLADGSAREIDTSFGGRLVTDGVSVFAADGPSPRISRLDTDGTVTPLDIAVGAGLHVSTREVKVASGYLYFPTNCRFGGSVEGCADSGVYRVAVAGGALEAVVRVPVLPPEQGAPWQAAVVAIEGEDIYLAVSGAAYAKRFYHSRSGGPWRLLYELQYDRLRMTATGAGVVVCTEEGAAPILYLPKEGMPRELGPGSCPSMVWRNGHLYWSTFLHDRIRVAALP